MSACTCPFCLGASLIPMEETEVLGDKFMHYLCCTSCGARGPLGKTEDEAVSLWNRATLVNAAPARFKE